MIFSKSISFIVFMGFHLSALSQDSLSVISQPQSTLGMFIEMGGFINVLSLNLDYQYTYHSDHEGRDQIGMRAGYGLFLYNLKTIPVLIIGSSGDRHRWEYGLGVTATPFGIPTEIKLSSTLLKPSASAGWRFEERGGGWLIRGVLTVLYDTGNGGFLPLFGISFGGNFQFH